MPVYSSKRRIIVRRKAAMGDVLDTTPIVARLKAENPDVEIGVQTLHPEVYKGLDVPINPHWEHFELIDLDGVYEKHLRKKIPLNCYSLEVFGDEDTVNQVYLAHDRTPCSLPEDLDFDRCIGIYAARTWPQRTLPLSFWQEVIQQLHKRGWQVMILGTNQDHQFQEQDGVFDTTGKVSLQRQAFLIDQCAAFISSDSGLMNVANTTRTPIVALMTMTLPHHAYRVRRGVLGWGFYPIVASVPCVGCQDLQDKPVTFFECRWTDGRRNYCVNAFDPEAVVWKATSVARQHKEMGTLKYA
jgi:ADP-heptose:LPS heptosyltransferase